MQEIDTEEDKKLFLRAKLKLEAIEARKRKAAAFEVSNDDMSTPRAGSSASTMALGVRQGCKTPPIQKIARAMTMTSSASTVPLPTPPSARPRPGPSRPPTTPAAAGGDRKRPREEDQGTVTLEERARSHNFAKRLALQGAMLSTPVKAEPISQEVDETGMEIMRAEVIEDTEMPASAGKDVGRSQVDPPETRAASSSNNSTLGEQDLDLILNVQDHDQLDFEPEEGILDNTVEVKRLNHFFSLRPDFRMIRRKTTRLLRRNESIGCHNITSQNEINFMQAKMSLFIQEIITIYINLYYLYNISRISYPQISTVILFDAIVC